MGEHSTNPMYGCVSSHTKRNIGVKMKMDRHRSRDEVLLGQLEWLLTSMCPFPMLAHLQEASKRMEKLGKVRNELGIVFEYS